MDNRLLPSDNKVVKILKRFFFSLFSFLVILSFLVGGLYLGYVPSDSILSVLNLRKFPEPQNPKNIKLICNLGGQEYLVEHTLYESINYYYKKDPRKKRIFLSGDYSSFVYSNPKDNSITDLVSKIKNIGQVNGLSEDRIVDLVICFVQSIPYDSEKAKKILSYSQEVPIPIRDISLIISRYPYETLYDGTGICTDKSYLLAYMLKELGYGTSLMIFDKDRHMAVGIKSPLGYTSFSSNYSFIETTNTGYRVGQLPIINRDSGEAVSLEIDYIKETNSSSNLIIPDLVKGNINPPNKIISIAEGKKYLRVIELAQRKNQIKTLVSNMTQKDIEIKEKRKELDLLSVEVTKKENNLKSAESTLRLVEDNYKQNPTFKNYQDYQRAYSLYINAYNNFENEIKIYNQSVLLFNNLVAIFNESVEKYNYLIKLD